MTLLDFSIYKPPDRSYAKTVLQNEPSAQQQPREQRQSREASELTLLLPPIHQSQLEVVQALCGRDGARAAHHRRQRRAHTGEQWGLVFCVCFMVLCVCKGQSCAASSAPTASARR